MKKTIPNLLTLVCLLVAIMGLSVVTAHAATVTGTAQRCYGGIREFSVTTAISAARTDSRCKYRGKAWT